MVGYLEPKGIPYYISNRDYPRTEFIIWLENCLGWLLETRQILFKDLFEQWIALKGLRASIHKEIIREKTKLYRVLIDSLSNFTNLFEWLKYLNLHLMFKDSLAMSVRYKENIRNLRLLVLSLKNGRDKSMSMEEFSISVIQGDRVALLTRHSSKGLEFEVVIVPFLDDGSLPFYKNFNYPNKMEEEKRVLFVCISRAKNTCYLLMSKRIYGYNKKTF